MNIPHHIHSQYDRFTRWLFDSAFPYWGTIGGDGSEQKPFQWGAHEQLKMDGSPDLPGYKRLRVQARQLYSFTQGALLGWTQANSITEQIYNFMQNAQLGEGHWAKTLTREGNILDSSSDLYDLAFLVFSLAWYARLSKDQRPIQQARQTVQWIERFMAYPQRGYKNIVPFISGYRQQNPHMHLLEAILALYETTGEEQDLVMAHKLIDLFETNLFNHQAGVLEEYFVESWMPVPFPPITEVEPGHQYEWIWLLSEYERLTGISHKTEMQRMYDFNERHAVDQLTGLVADKVQKDGTLVNKSARLWVQTEAIRATSLMQDEKSYQHLSKIVNNLLRRYFKNCPNGTWQDQLTHCYHYNNTKIPTSSFYHIVSGYMQLHHTLQ
ncbi:Mannose or cellobiose epimerase [Commensalibacter communis]|uniref:N-acyl-D-glucosamine 2-epimerase family (YihS) n=1 Tax=Commensalibacter communis TaxID=2972786 RepID=A0A9W4TNZ7_9PROT|nr:AGE family epimerase/isomerase [Commensalibacter communis]CAI3937778.1 Mannose or cellobiose epimerase [Commensalibacter communis]CAI3942531.1 Mannose or cellobiose epimerase [Commensalibacter communis]CAI3944134.1 Mannose or cellobiose epimerase [Commensalibacter communis]CAI3945648.1 Mannose or cellobiose epimerase [Commensalibacter communis]